MKTTDLKKKLLFQLIFFFLIPGKFFAATFTVINTANTGAGSLRQAVISANAGGVGPHIVNFSVSGTIVLSTELPAITNPTTFNGGGINVSGGNTVAIWGSMSSNGSDKAITFNSMNFTAANSTLRGGGVFEIRQGYRATFNDCNFYGNNCTGTGGAISFNILSTQIASMRPLNCNRCSFYNNHSTSNGAAFNNNNGVATFKNCSFLNNSTTSAGAAGGAYSATSNTETSNFVNCTIVNNSCNAASSGGGLRLVGTKNLLNNIVYGNTANGIANDVNNGTGTMSQVTNLVGVTTGTAVAWAFTSNPSLGALATCTNGLYYKLPGAIALNAGSASGATLTAPATDICNTARTANPDLGAKELPICTNPTVPVLSASSTTNCGTVNTTLSISTGTLNSATAWKWYSGSCGGTLAGTGTSIVVAPAITTTYYARGEGGCVTPGSCASITITVNSLSVAPTGITGTTTICSGSSTTLTVTGGTLGTGATVQWFTGSCGGTSAGTGNSITVSPATTTAYFVRYGGTCNNTTCASSTVTVNTLSVAPTGITGTTSICNGGSTTLTLSGGTAGTGATAQWFSGSCGGTSAGTGNSITVSPAITTTYFVRYSGACNNTTCATATVTVNTLSVAPTGITGTTTICSGSSTTLTIAGGSAGSGATVQWFTGSCGGTSAGTGNSITVSPVATTTYFVRYNGTCNTTTCASATVTVNTLSTAPTGITGATIICSGGTTTLTRTGGTAGTGATVQWFSGSCGGTSAGTGNSITVSPGATTIYFVRYSGTCNTTTCASTTVTVNTLSTAPTGITGTTSICDGATTTLSVTGGVIGTGATAQWFIGSCGGASAGTGNSITVSPSATTTYFVRYGGACNNTTCVSVTVTVNTPSTTATSAVSNALYNEICIGANVTLTANGGSLGTGGNWVWYNGGCGSGAAIGIGASITVTPSVPGTFQYFVRAEGACPPTACQSVSVNVISASPLGTVHYTASISDGCVGAASSLFSVNAVANCSYYRWTCNQPGVLFNGNPSPYETTVPNVNISFVSLPTGGASGWSICVFGGNACRYTNTICTWVRAKLSPPATINGSIIGCPGTLGQSYSVASVAGAVTYQWSATGGMIITGNGSQSITIDFPAGFISGTLSVYGITACNYNGPARTMTISRAPATPGVLTGPSYPCPNATTVYSVAPVPGAVSYTWTTSVAGAVVTGTTNTCSIVFPAGIPGGSSVSVVANSICPFSSGVRAKGIASGQAGVPTPISGLNGGQCGQQEVSYSVTPVALAVGYSWSSTCGTFVGPTNLSAVSINWPANFTSCLLTVSATNNCGAGGARNLTITGASGIPPSITGNISPCSYAVEAYSTAGTYGASAYIWTVPAGATILGPINGPSIIVYWGTQSGSITVRSSNSCGNSGLRSLPCVISCRQGQLEKFESGINAKFFPNPVSEKAIVKFNAADASEYHLNLVSVLGSTIMSYNVAAIEGINMVYLDLNTIAKGVYLLNIMGGENHELIKVVVD